MTPHFIWALVFGLVGTTPILLLVWYAADFGPNGPLPIWWLPVVFAACLAVIMLWSFLLGAMVAKEISVGKEGLIVYQRTLSR